MSNTNRWGLAAAGFLMQMALGAVYAWSVFRTPLARQFHWSIEEVTFTFTVSIFVLGVACFFGGLWLNRKGPRVVALTGGFLYGFGVFLASFSANNYWYCCWRIRRRSLGNCACGYAPDSKCRRITHLRLSRRRLSCGYDGRRLFYAKPAGGVEA